MPEAQPISWKFVLVTKGFEQLKVLRIRNGRKDNIHGTYPAGFFCELMVGDRVYVKHPGRTWLKKFELVMLPESESGFTCPAIKYGKAFGPYPGQYRALKNLTKAAFDNEGIDPAWGIPRK